MNAISFHKLLLSTIFAVFLILLYKNQASLLSSMNMAEYGEKYSKSQYILGDAHEHEISDSDLYIYAGFAYWQGQDPTTINFEHPPAAKYFFGLSQALFGNSLILYVVLYPIILYLFYLLLKRVLMTQLAQFVGVLTLATLPLFTQYFDKTVLDIPLLVFILLFFLLLASKPSLQLRRFVAIGVILGVLMSIKYPIPFIFIPLGILTLDAFLLEKSGKITVAITSLYHKVSLLFTSVFTAGLVYLAGYSVYFYHNHSFFTFLQFEKYRFDWWFGDRATPKFIIFESLFIGKHESWWSPGSISTYAEWSMLLPILCLAATSLFFFAKKTKLLTLLYIFSTVSLIGFGLGSGSSLRYLLIIVPFWILITLSGIEALLLSHFNKISK